MTKIMTANVDLACRLVYSGTTSAPCYKLYFQTWWKAALILEGSVSSLLKREVS